MSGREAELISVLIPTFNAAKYLAETLESVLAQDWPALEVIVCDDGSEDDSVAVARRADPKIVVAPGPHRGLAATRNRAIALARGQWLLHLDADDLLEPGAIATLAREFLPEYDLVVGRLKAFISPDLPSEVAARFAVPAEPQSGHLPGTTLTRRAVFETFGLLDEDYTIGADLAWFAKARDMGAAIHHIDDIVLRRRIHGNNQSLSGRNEWSASVLRTVRDAMRRKREQG